MADINLCVNDIKVDINNSNIVTEDQVEKFLKKAGVKIMGYAKDLLINSPEAQEHYHHNQDTGALARSIQADDVEKEDTEHYKVNVGSNLEYAVYIECGTGIFAENGQGRQTGWKWIDRQGKEHWTRGITPSPYLRPALDKFINLDLNDTLREVNK